jgi:hypothetical protein
VGLPVCLGLGSFIGCIHHRFWTPLPVYEWILIVGGSEGSSAWFMHSLHSLHSHARISYLLESSPWYV